MTLRSRRIFSLRGLKSLHDHENPFRGAGFPDLQEKREAVSGKARYLPQTCLSCAAPFTAPIHRGSQPTGMGGCRPAADGTAPARPPAALLMRWIGAMRLTGGTTVHRINRTARINRAITRHSASGTTRGPQCASPHRPAGRGPEFVTLSAGWVSRAGCGLPTPGCTSPHQPW